MANGCPAWEASFNQNHIHAGRLSQIIQFRDTVASPACLVPHGPLPCGQAAERPPMSLDLERLCERLRQFGYLDDDARNAAEMSVEDRFPGWLSAIKPADDRDTMTVGFDPFNLEVAVDAVMKSAAEKEQDITFSMYTAKRVDLRDREQVRTHLMDQVRRHYTQAKQHPDGIRIASIERVIYSPIAFVFEENIGEMHPPPVGAETGDPITHLAYFWSVL